MVVQKEVYEVREEPALRDGSQKTKTLVSAAAGGIDPPAAGGTRAPRNAVPAAPPKDTIGT